MNPIFGRGLALQTRLFLAVVFSVGLIVADARFHQFSGVRLYLDSFVSPLIYLADTPRKLADGVSEQIKTRSELIEDNRRLEQQLFLLRSDLLRTQQLTQENERLRSLLGSPLQADSRKMVAEILAVDSDPFIHQVVIDRGERNGVFEGQPVVNDQGVVGQVIAVGKTTSRVLLITDLSHAIPVRIMRNDIRAIAGGTGQLDELMLKNVPRSADVREGDLLVTSGLGGRFPMGYPVAKVTRVSSEEGKPFADVKAVPLASLDRLRYLLLLWPETVAARPATVPVGGLPAASAALATSAATATAVTPATNSAATAVPARKASASAKPVISKPVVNKPVTNKPAARKTAVPTAQPPVTPPGTQENPR